MKKVSVKKQKSKLFPLLVTMLLSLILLAVVLYYRNMSLDTQGSAKGKDDIPKCKANETLKQNAKGKYLCVKLPNSGIVDEKDCKGGQVYVRDPQGKMVCHEKCQSGETLSTDRNTGKWGCVKIRPDKVELRPVKCAENEVV